MFSCCRLSLCVAAFALTIFLAPPAFAADGPPPELLARAEKGDAAAQADLGVKYWRADGMPQDVQKAMFWLQKAASHGSAKAQSALGAVYRDGVTKNKQVTEVKADAKLAEKWFSKAAAQDDAEALYFMAGLTNKPEEKIALLEKAANGGNVEAQTTLGYLYSGITSSIRIEPDVKKSIYWHDKAAHTYAGGTMLTTEDIDSQHALGRRYLTGDGVEKDEAKAAELFRLIAAHNTFVDAATGADYQDQAQDAYLQLGLLYQNGHGVKKDAREAARWFARAAKLGSPEGWYRLGQAHEKGEGVQKDKLQAYLAYARLACKPETCEFADVLSPTGKTPDTDPAALAQIAQDALVASMSEAELAEAKRVAKEEGDLSFQLFNGIFISSTFTSRP